MSVKIGTANYGDNFVKRNYWSLKDGESVFRIVPPLGDLADAGRWSFFYSVHFGYKNTKGKMKPFQSPLVKNRKTKMVETPDAALERIDTLKAKQASAKAAGDGVTAEKIGLLLKQYNLDNNHHVIAIDEQGNIGILKLRHRAKLALDAEIKALRDKGVDPLSVDNGRFFIFRRSGTALDTTFQVKVKQAQRDIPGVGTVYQDVVHVLTSELINRLSKEAPPLDKLHKRLTSDEVARIVKESDLMTGRSPVLDELFDNKNDDNTVAESTEETNTTQANTGQTHNFFGGNTAAPTVVTSGVTTTVGNTTTAGGSSAIPNTTAAVVPTTQTTPTTVAPAKTTAQVVSEQSDEEFLKSLGL